MKIAFGAAAALLLVTIGWAEPAAAQGGSYQGSCGNVERRGDTLIASCRGRDGGWVRSALEGVGRCAGDIGNNNGVLQCQTRDGRQAYGRVLPGPGPGPGPGYGVPPQPRYGEPGPGYERDGYWERCRHLRREAEELRARYDREWDPRDRERIAYRLREIREQEERCPR